MKRIEAIVGKYERFKQLESPMPGWFRPLVAENDPIHRGCVLGELDVLGTPYTIVAPEIHGHVHITPEPRHAVQYGDRLVLVAATKTDDVTTVRMTRIDKPNTATADTAHGLVFRAPTSGRFYGRPSPDKPAFTAVGAELAAGATICLLEVMKTFHRVTYGGSDLPARARVREVLVAEGADVNAGDPLLALEPLA